MLHDSHECPDSSIRETIGLMMVCCRRGVVHPQPGALCLYSLALVRNPVIFKEVLGAFISLIDFLSEGQRDSGPDLGIYGLDSTPFCEGIYSHQKYSFCTEGILTYSVSIATISYG